MSNLNALVQQLKINTEKVKAALEKNEQAVNAAINAPTPAAAAAPANTAVTTGNQIQNLAVQNQKIAETIGVPTTIPEVQVPAAAAMTAATNNAKMANSLAALAVGVAPGTPVATAAVNAANASTKAALTGNVPVANKNAQLAASVAVAAAANASPNAKKIANSLKNKLMKQ